MLDVKRIRETPDEVKKALQYRCEPAMVDAVLELDEERRGLIAEADALKNERNTVSKEIGRVKREGGDAAEQMEAMREVGKRIGELDETLRGVEERFQDALLRIPNTPHESAPVGADASKNVEVRTWGKRRAFDFEPQAHWDIGDALGLFDFDRAVKMTGSGFPLFTGMGARLERALISFMLDVHTREHGYHEILPPFVCNTAAMTGTGQLPKMAEDMYDVARDDLWLIPTAEVPVTNYFREEIIQQDLPVYLTAYTPCFRREAGAAGKDTRGLLRVHQFNKVELVKFCRPETSMEELEKLVADAEDILQRLELPYRVLELCTGDLSFAAAKCYDIELWAPGQNGWLEVSSCSNFLDFQARRAQIRFKNEKGKNTFVHTLNGSGTALPRLVVALLETGQQADGTVVIPQALRPYLGGIERLEA